MKKYLYVLGLFLTTQAFAFQNLLNPVEYFQTIAAQVHKYKYQIQHCYEMTKSFAECDGGKHGIDPDINTPTGNIASLTTMTGVITVFPVPIDDILLIDSYVLTPSISPHTFSWTASGLSVEKEYVEF